MWTLWCWMCRMSMKQPAWSRCHIQTDSLTARQTQRERTVSSRTRLTQTRFWCHEVSRCLRVTSGTQRMVLKWNPPSRELLALWRKRSVHQTARLNININMLAQALALADSIKFPLRLGQKAQRWAHLSPAASHHSRDVSLHNRTIGNRLNL